jgi:hypothetical protein
VCGAVALVGVIVVSVIVLTRPEPGTYRAVGDICGHVDLAPLEDVGLVPDNGTGVPDPSAVPGSAGERIMVCQFEVDDMSAPADGSTCRCHLRLWAAAHPDPARATTAMDRQIAEQGGSRTGVPYNPKDRGVGERSFVIHSKSAYDGATSELFVRDGNLHMVVSLSGHSTVEEWNRKPRLDDVDDVLVTVAGNFLDNFRID